MSINPVRVVTSAAISGSSLGYQQLSVGSTVVTINPPPGATAALIAVTGGSGVRFRDDGENPTSALGYPLLASSSTTYAGNLSALRLVAASGTEATLDLVFYS